MEELSHIAEWAVRGEEIVPTVTLEAIMGETLWIWNTFLGLPGCRNDVNVLDPSNLFNKIRSGTYPPDIQYTIAGVKRDIPYWLLDGIYPKWPMFVQKFTKPVTRKEKLMSTAQEAARKYVEREFGVLNDKWHILARPSRFCGNDKMQRVMQRCIIVRAHIDSKYLVSRLSGLNFSLYNTKML